MPLFDTWAWVEYFDGTPAGARLRPLIEGPDVATSILTLAELSDLHARTGDPDLESRAHFIASRGTVLDVSPTVALRAGRMKWAQRKKRHPLGLADAMIYETAREHGLELVTGDPGFKGLPGVKMVQ